MTPSDALIGTTPSIQAIRDQVVKFADRQRGARRSPAVLIVGATGTGKGLLARIVHDSGPQAGGPFVSVNCAAIPTPLLEAELFGHERGAFTDARQARAGLFQAAQGGTLFLDEIGLLPLAVQAKLLTAIEDREVRRLGATRTEQVDCAIIAATNAELAADVRAGRFREDLYHRLGVIVFALPPLAGRGEDIMELARHFLARAAEDYGVPTPRIGDEAERALRAHAWPGNVRELAHAMERAVLVGERDELSAAALGLAAPAAAPAPAA
ncbi:MAG TPA: sigma 54-interacting transcriptional regulator, partial [Terriglobales bacterium]|nr:sigma 54-interacting transcriptional regulator [Terriglobales bacterium]